MTDRRGGHDAEPGPGGPHGLETFRAQGSAFLKQNLSDEPEFDYAENRPPRSDGLAQRTLTLALRDRPDRVRCAFGSDEVELQVFGEPGPRRVTAGYEAFEMAPRIFLVSFRPGTAESAAVVLDLAGGVATLVEGEMGVEGITSRLESARIEEIAGLGEGASESDAGGGTGMAPYHPDFGLGGTRLLNVYAANAAYEHVYLTDVYVTWLGTMGPEVGQADTEEYRAFKISNGIYLVSWNEKVLTTQMTFLFNFLTGNCVSQLFGRVDGHIVHKTIGAKTSLIHTALPEFPDVPRLVVHPATR